MYKIEINVIWGKKFIDGTSIAEIVFDYFCSGLLSPIKETVLGISVNCMEIANAKDFILNLKPNVLYVNVVLAEKNLARLDIESIIINKINKIAQKEKAIILVPICFDDLGKKYIGNYQRGFKYEYDRGPILNDCLKKRIDSIKETSIRQSIPYMLTDILNACVNRYYNLVLGKNESKLGVFISHTKSNDNGKAELLKLQDNLTSAIKEIDTFVDRTEIGMGNDFQKIIYKNVTTRAMILLLTDDISSKEWCQREIFYAKKYLMPIIIVDAINRKDDRLFTYLGNVPLIKYNGDNIREVYEFFAFEVLSCLYNRFKYEFENDVKVLCRKVELLDIIATDFPLKKDLKERKIIYPDPPIYWIENDIIQNAAKHYGVSIQTPITRLLDKYPIKKCNVLISSSKDGIDYLDDGCCVSGIDYAVNEITRYLIFNGFTIINGGHFKTDGFNEIIINQIEKYKKRISDKKVYGISFVDAYTYGKDKENIDKFFDEHVYITSRTGRKYTDYIRIILPPEEELTLSKEEQLKRNRIRITNSCNMHIVVGGVTDSEITGIDQEIDLSINKNTPIYLIGGYGYKAKQLSNKFINENNFTVLHNGLDLDENKMLAKEKDIDRILNLIFIGMRRLS